MYSTPFLPLYSAPLTLRDQTQQYEQQIFWKRSKHDALRAAGEMRINLENSLITFAGEWRNFTQLQRQSFGWYDYRFIKFLNNNTNNDNNFDNLDLFYLIEIIY